MRIRSRQLNRSWVYCEMRDTWVKSIFANLISRSPLRQTVSNTRILSRLAPNYFIFIGCLSGAPMLQPRLNGWLTTLICLSFIWISGRYRRAFVLAGESAQTTKGNSHDSVFKEVLLWVRQNHISRVPIWWGEPGPRSGKFVVMMRFSRSEKRTSTALVPGHRRLLL